METKINLKFKIIKCAGWEDEVWFTEFWWDLYDIDEDTIGLAFKKIIWKYKINWKVMFSYILSNKNNLSEKDLVEIDIKKQLLWNIASEFSYDNNNRYWRSSRTIEWYKVDENDFKIWWHSLKEEFENNIWKYAYITISFN